MPSVYGKIRYRTQKASKKWERSLRQRVPSGQIYWALSRSRPDARMAASRETNSGKRRKELMEQGGGGGGGKEASAPVPRAGRSNDGNFPRGA